MRLPVLAVALCAAAFAADNLARVKAEPNVEKRSELALAAAEDALGAARRAYREADDPAFSKALAEVREGIEIARESLKGTKRGNKYFKRAEQRSRSLDRKLEDFAKEAALDDRQGIEEVHKLAEEAHAFFLNGVLRK